MQTILHSLFLLATVALFGACSVQARFQPSGGTPTWKPDLPAPTPEIAEAGTLHVRFFCPTLDDFDDQLDQKLAEGLVRASQRSAIGAIKKRSDPKGTAHYEIAVSEAAINGKFLPNVEAAILGGTGGAVVGGVATKKLSGAFLPAVVGAAGGLLAAGTKQTSVTFMIECTQHTAAAATESLKGNNQYRMLEDLVARDIGTKTKINSSEAKDLISSTYLDVESHRLVWVKYCTVIVEGGVLSNERERLAAAARELIEEFPEYVFGGRTVF